MAEAPTVSVILASYNYEAYVGTMLASILAQTFRDLEIIVVDDASTDGSRKVIESFADPRIKLYVNDRNMGPSATYNRGGSLAQGEFLAYMDSDDWLDPRRIELQIEHFRRAPAADIVGTYIAVCDEDGKRHPNADLWEAYINRPHDLNALDPWIVGSYVSSPTMMFRRSLHARIGFRDPTMRRASDYEFWTRALRAGCRFELMQIPLLVYRVHARNTGTGSPREGFFEIAYSLGKNLLPAIDAPKLHLLGKAIGWIVTHEQFGLLPEVKRCRLLALVLEPPAATFAAFKQALASEQEDAQVELGRRLYRSVGV